MATESTAVSTDPTAAGKTEPPSSECARRSEFRIPTASETLATVPEFDAADANFEPHDTIPAPPWLDEHEDKLAPAPARSSS